MKIRVIALLTLFAICTCISATANADNPFTRDDEWVYGYFHDQNGKYSATVQGHVSRDIDKDQVSVWILTPGNSQFTEYTDFEVVVSPGNIGHEFLTSFDATVYFPVGTTDTNIFFKYGYPDGSNIVFSPTFALCTNNDAMTKPCCEGVAKKGKLSVRVSPIQQNGIDKYQIGIWAEYPADKFEQNSTAVLEEIVNGQYIEVPGAAHIYDAIETGYKLLTASTTKVKSEATKDLKYVLRYQAFNMIYYVPDAMGFLVCDLAMDPRPEFCQTILMTITPLHVPLVMLPSGEVGQPELGEPPVLEEGATQETPLESEADLETVSPEPAGPDSAANTTGTAGVGGYDWTSGCSLSPTAKHYGGLTLILLLCALIPPLVIVRVRRKK